MIIDYLILIEKLKKLTYIRELTEGEKKRAIKLTQWFENDKRMWSDI